MTLGTHPVSTPASSRTFQNCLRPCISTLSEGAQTFLPSTFSGNSTQLWTFQPH